MTERRIPIGRRPVTAPAQEAWVKRGDPAQAAKPVSRAELYSARLTLDVTPELRGRIKLTAFGQGVTVAELVRGLLEREFGDTKGGG
jgi:hypothetical protein